MSSGGRMGRGERCRSGGAVSARVATFKVGRRGSCVVGPKVRFAPRRALKGGSLVPRNGHYAAWSSGLLLVDVARNLALRPSVEDSSARVIASS